ncbi:MAG: response regulator transcription factor [Anaerolineales bacterium]|nr:response regulator transcription factor [Anaerolineales bacterium]
MKPVRILLADDHDLVRAGMNNALQDQPHLQIVGEVDDGPTLLEALHTLHPDLLLIDVTMPHFEPLSTMQHVRMMYPELLILVVSAHDDDVYVQGLLRAGVNGYHLKDQPLSELRLAIKQVLSGRRWISGPLVDRLLHPTESQQKAFPKLSPRQLDILPLLAKGLDNRTIAAQLGLSVKTIETHLTRLYRQMKVQSRLEATTYLHAHPEILSAHAQVSAPQPTIIPSTEQVAIMVVDDNQGYRQQLRRMVTRAYPPALTYEAANTADALYLARQLTPRLAFVDVVLGDEDGIRCARRIKREAAQTRVILMSAYPDREFHRMALEAGAVAFIDKKDLDAATLFQIISDAVG